jgi:hypothetical protein
MPIKRELFKPHYSKIMTPKNALQKKVFELRKLPKITDKKNTQSISFDKWGVIQEAKYFV